MADRKVYMNVEIRILVRADEKVSIEELVNEMDYNFVSKTEGAEIEDTSIEGWYVIDSK